MELLEELTRLRADTLRARHDVDEAAVGEIRRRFEARLESVKTEHVLADADRICAAVVELNPLVGTFGLTQAEVLVELDGVDSSAAFVSEVFDRIEVSKKTALMIDIAHAFLLATLQSRGLRITKLRMVGKTQECLERHQSRLDRSELANHDLEIRDLTAGDIKDVTRVRREHFAANAHGLIDDPPTPEVQARLDARSTAVLSKRLEGETPTHWVVLRGGEVVGDFGFGTRAEPGLGSCAHVEIVLTVPIQGLGLGALAYQLMLERMVELGTDHVCGMTSNPGVVHMATRMGRWVDAIEFKYDPDAPISELASVAMEQPPCG